MTPGTIVLLHSPLTTAAAWGALPETLRSSGLHVTVPEVLDDEEPPYAGRYVASAALQLNAAGVKPPIVLAGHSGAGPLLPAVGAAQRAAHRQVGGYVFIDARLPGTGETTRLDLYERDSAESGRSYLESGGFLPDEAPPPGLHGQIRPRGEDFFAEPLPMPQDWPDAPGGFLLLTSGAYESQARQAKMRGWPVVEHEAGHFAAHEDPAGTAAAFRRLLDLI